jgi:hypothetical protein
MKDLPHIKNIFDRFDRSYDQGCQIIFECKTKLIECHNTKTRPDKDLVDKINTVKIFCSETSRNTVFDLQINLGAQSLLIRELNTSLYIPNIIAEGDTGILKQKKVGDSLKRLTSTPMLYSFDLIQRKRSLFEFVMLIYLFLKLFVVSAITKHDKPTIWIENFNLIKSIADISVKYQMDQNYHPISKL